MNQNLEKTVQRQREMLKAELEPLMHQIADALAPILADRAAMEVMLKAKTAELNLTDWKYIYVLNAGGVQLTANICNGRGADESQLGRDRSQRPYMEQAMQGADFSLSESYISRNKRRPSLTAIQAIKVGDAGVLGFVCLDYDLRRLPHTEGIYQESRRWRQIKGDPAIRGGLFTQQRVNSMMDERLDDVLALMDELILEHGVFHGKFHFSSSRATVWTVDDPYQYRLLDIDDLSDPDICLAYPRRPYFDKAVVPAADVMKIFDMFRDLRFADETIYLRSGSLNVVNGMVALNFSCDGSHYIPYDEFLGKGLDFWFGGDDGSHGTYEDAVEAICMQGCDTTNETIARIEAGDMPEEYRHLGPDERELLLKELRSIMDVYSAE